LFVILDNFICFNDSVLQHVENLISMHCYIDQTARIFAE
jgi:hypothetical protein